MKPLCLLHLQMALVILTCWCFHFFIMPRGIILCGKVRVQLKWEEDMKRSKCISWKHWYYLWTSSHLHLEEWVCKRGSLLERCKHEGKVSLLTCLSSVLVNATEHSEAILGILSKFCLLSTEHAQLKNLYKVAIIWVCYPLLLTIALIFIQDRRISTGTRFRHSEIADYSMVCASRVCYSLS